MHDITIPWPPRTQQNEILSRFERVVKSNKKFMFVDAPVGIGKSQAVVMMAKWFKDNIDAESKFDVITNSIILQDQYLKDFQYMKSIQGVENYRCAKYRTNCLIGGVMGKMKSKPCLDCEYKTKRLDFQDATIGITNFHMFINFWMYAPETIQKRQSKVLFIDEAHSFEEVYCSFIDSNISINYLSEEAKCWDPAWTNDIKSIRDIKSMATFIKEKIIPTIMKNYEAIIAKASLLSDSDPDKIRIVQEATKMKRIKCKYGRFIDDEINWNSNWVIEISNPGTVEVVAKVEAVWAKRYLNEIWDKYDHVVFLTGTIIHRTFFMGLMGCNVENSDFMTIASPFKVENRPIFFQNIGSMSYHNKVETMKLMIPALKNILIEHKGQKGIIHTGNYEIARWINDALANEFPRLTFHNGDRGSRSNALRRHFQSEDDTVLVSPSMISGIDLKDNLSRFQVIMKVPYPNLSSEKVKARMRSSIWYTWKTLCDIIQCYGRSVRSEEDYADTYILDENFERLINDRLVKAPEFLTNAIISYKKEAYDDLEA